MTGDPTEYDYSRPTRGCDIVMKGGITSGVVYPHAVCELAQTYRLRSVGGTSAGAIAAAAAAAAELGRDADGFRKLAALPSWLGAGANLFSLFQPQRRTRPLFRFFVAGLGSPRWRLLRLLGAGIRNFPLPLAAGAVPGAALVGLAIGFGGSTVLLAAALVAGVLLLVLGAVIGLSAGLLWTLGRALPRNGFGLCSGAGGDTALTPWLSALLDDLAARPDADGPLTFGDLELAGIRLELMTTNLTNRRPHKLPWETREFFFDPGELRRLFPDSIVRWMEEHPPPAPETPADRREWELQRALLGPLRPFPATADLPVIVAARMSLSFPVLLSAVPLWSLDMSRRANQTALDQWRRWSREHPDEWQTAEGAPSARPLPERCWFSDGGITSNFPVHFFDAPLPLRPTFAINLRPFHPDHPRSRNEAENVYLPAGSGAGLLEWWYRFPAREGLGTVGAFLGSVVRTMQNHLDEAQMRVPGYRDRVVHVSFADDEGGMNLTMPPPLIRALTARGRFAAAELVRRFAHPPESISALSWDSHRWTRFRSSLAALGELVESVDRGHRTPPEMVGDRTYAELAARDDADHPAAYRWARDAQEELGREFVDAVAGAAGVLLDGRPESLAEGAPRPQPKARIAPRP